MSYILLDESGDLGFDFTKNRTTKYFLVTFLFVEKIRPIQKIVKGIHRNLRKKYKIKSALHAAHDEPATRVRICKQLAAKKCKIMVVYLEKSKVHTQLQDEKHVLYNYITNILLDRIMTKQLVSRTETVQLIAARRETNKFLNQNFKDYLERQAVSRHGLKLSVSIRTPSQEKALQAVDIASWSIFKKYEYQKDTYYNLLKEIIVEENPLFR
ncbi:MAG: DUF3800 domain-containing protein [Parcubacteria group bacterium]